MAWTRLLIYVPMPKSRMRRASMAMCTGIPRGRIELPAIERETRREAAHALAHRRDRLLVADVLQRLHDQLAGLAHLRFAESTRGDGGRSQTNAARVERLVDVE